MSLPNAEKAFIDIRKLEDYCLNPEHPTGKHKAHVFKKVLGLSASDAESLKEYILDMVQFAEAEVGQQDEYGQRDTVDFEVSTDMGTAIVRSAWIIRISEDFPRLTSCYVL